MIDIEIWMREFTSAVQGEFGSEVCFIGLQGSYGRGEASETSDIDVVVIFDILTAERIERYERVIEKLPYRDRICGFVSGREELMCWDRGDLFQFCRDTRSLAGTLDELTSAITEDDARRSVLTGACGIYHACCHNLLHEKSPEILCGLLKAAFFTLRAKYYCETGAFIIKRSDLAELLSTEDAEILNFKSMDVTEGKLREISSKLLVWSGKLIKKYGVH